jgi:hypothetical protein
MFSSEPARRAGRRTRSTILPVLVVLSAALLGVLGYESLAGSSSSPRSFIAAEPDALRPHESPPGDLPGALGEADGVVPDGVTVFDDTIPAVANLDPDLLKALRRAAVSAAVQGITFYVNSGWRSREYQNQLLRQAISKYGSEDAAARWVATAATSPHVSGDAVDIGHSDATAWLSEQGAEYGVCQIYRNEPWHYELRPRAVVHGCPRMYTNPTQDPRMQR